ncbi:MAG: cysteine hydrolase [Lachnospiraceae bacterium]|nr:cysteine hydrolase [Lachnospiraceae bacterium]
MAKKYLIVVDMQQDFVYGMLGSQEAREIVPHVIEKVKGFDGEVIFTRDTHTADYLNTQEGRMLPVEHCIDGSEGWRLIEPLDELCSKGKLKCYLKGTFGCIGLAEDLRAQDSGHGIESIELVGVCTDICVVSNALLLKAYMPEVSIYVDSSCCAGVTPQKHEAALETMRSCQINVI